MKITHSYGDANCADGECPTIHVTDNDKILVQGSLVSPADRTGLNIPSHEDVVIFDRAVFERIARKVLA